ncbi:MAG: class I SAM-dependent methyltransferase [Boseongicola sp.]
MEKQDQQNMSACSICGGNKFVPGPLGRMAAKNTLPPRCENCGSLERHRIVRQVYDAIPVGMHENARALQFADDPAAPRERFKSFEISSYGIENSLDMASIDRPNESYDWVIANHVLEHVEDDFAAMRELLRIITAKGVIQITVPSPSSALDTWDLPEAVPTGFGHWRGYGSNLPLHFSAELKDRFGLQVISRDEPTNRWDIVYLFMKSHDIMQTIGKALLDSDLPTLRCA